MRLEFNEGYLAVEDDLLSDSLVLPSVIISSLEDSLSQGNIEEIDDNSFRLNFLVSMDIGFIVYSLEAVQKSDNLFVATKISVSEAELTWDG